MEEKEKNPVSLEAKVIEVNVDGCIEGDLTIYGERVVVHIGGDVTGSVNIRQMDAENVRLMINGEDYEGDEAGDEDDE